MLSNLVQTILTVGKKCTIGKDSALQLPLIIFSICLERKATGVNHRQTVEVASTRKTTAMSDCSPWRKSLVCTNDE